MIRLVVSALPITVILLGAKKWNIYSFIDFNAAHMTTKNKTEK